ncbi:MAG: hypothetical protein AAF747_01975 [Planctomycetota bacterium]
MSSEGRLCPGCEYALAGLGEQGICPECGRKYSPSDFVPKPTWIERCAQLAASQIRRPPVLSPLAALVTLVMFLPRFESPLLSAWVVLLWCVLGGPLFALGAFIKLAIAPVEWLANADRTTRRYLLGATRWVAAPFLYVATLVVVVLDVGVRVPVPSVHESWSSEDWEAVRLAIQPEADALLGVEEGRKTASNGLSGNTRWHVYKGHPTLLLDMTSGAGNYDYAYRLLVYSPEHVWKYEELAAWAARRYIEDFSDCPMDIDVRDVHDLGGDWWMIDIVNWQDWVS